MSDDDRSATHQPSDGTWVSYTDDSGVYVHRTELDALRAAVGSSRLVVFVRGGEDVRDASKEMPF